MKHIFRYIIILSAALFAAPMAKAQDYNVENGVTTAKSVTGPNQNGLYTIKLETFANGESVVTKTSTPVDVVLVLDVSGSMEFPKGTTTRVANNTNISYNTVKNGTVAYFYRHNFGQYGQTDYEYCKIYTEEYQGHYYLYYDYGSNVNSSRRQYITSSGTQSTRPSTTGYNAYNITDPDQTIFTTSNNRPVVTAKESRLDALKPAVKAFIENISYNATHYTDSTQRDEAIDNRISIIKFSDANITSALCNLTTVNGNEATLKGYVDGLQSGGGTSAGTGMNLANTQFANYANDGSAKVVVFFTDGEPTDNYAAIGNTSNGGTNAYRAKNTYQASVFSVGLFTSAPESNTPTWNFLNYVSSNYPNATVTNNGSMSAGTGGSDQGFYKDASGDVDLTAIFSDISSGIGGSEEEVNSSTQIRDFVTSSFTLPDGATANNIRVSVWKIDRTTEQWVEDTTYPKTGITANIGKRPGDTRDTVGVTGFDFSKDDTTEGQGDGNWVGIRYDNSVQPPTPFLAGRKLVIEFDVLANGAATGGVGTATNTEESGVYIKKEDGTYENINSYEIPHRTLPVNIKITKNGLRHGESATFQIFKIRPKIDTLESVITGQRDSIVWRYNAIGKPQPAEKSYTPQEGDDAHDILEGKGWEKWSKVILTNKGADKVEVTKTLVSLDPNWVYLVTEDDWSWSYETTGTGSYQTTATVEVNPFRFTNTEKEDVPKHAEAVTINHFGYTIQGGEFNGKQEEHYKSSKTKL